jgi:hypothetical protein
MHVDGFKSDMIETWDKHTNRRIQTLYEPIRNDVARFVNLVHNECGISLRVTQALRTKEEQDELYAQGRTKPGGKVTNAKGGYSYHNYGLAFDICEIKDGKAIWDINYELIVPYAKELGFEWGGDFKSFKDKPHFQKSYGYSIGDLIAGKLQS